MSPRRTHAGAGEQAPAPAPVERRVLGHEVVRRVHRLVDLDELGAFPDAVEAAAVGL